MISPERRSEIALENIDTYDCGVIALQAVTGLPRAKAERVLAKHGYEPGTGTPRAGLAEALHELGYKVNQHPLHDAGALLVETPATFAMSHESGRFLIYVRKHVMPLVDGDLHNSRGSWHNPVELILEVLDK